MFVPDGRDPSISVQVLYGWITNHPGYLPDKHAGILILQLFVNIPNQLPARQPASPTSTDGKVITVSPFLMVMVRVL